MPNHDDKSYHLRHIVDLAKVYFPGLLTEMGWGEDVDPNTLTPADIKRIRTEIHRRWQLEYAEAMQRFPATRQKQLRQYGVPRGEWREWLEYPMKVSKTPWGAGSIGLYSQGQIGLTPKGVRPDVMAHEMAHATYFEQMPPVMKAVYPVAQRFAEWLHPEYKKAVMRYWARHERTPEPFVSPFKPGLRTTEGYPTAYEVLGTVPEKLPWYMEPFYGNLLYEVPDWPMDWEKNWVVWLGHWLKSKIALSSAEGQEASKISNWLEEISPEFRRGLIPRDKPEGLDLRRWLWGEGQPSPEELYGQPWQKPRYERKPERWLEPASGRR